MIDRDRFVAAGRPRWDRLEQLLRGVRGPDGWSELSALYRATCTDLARARSYGLPQDIEDYLDDLSGRAHNRLYGSRSLERFGLLRQLGADFPRELRRQWPFFLAANLMFYLPFVGMILLCLIDPDWARIVADPATLASVERAYERTASRVHLGEDAAMAGFYVKNNVGIAFRCFATGIAFGAGPVFFLIFNGLVIGAMVGYVTGLGLGGNIGEFIMGHAPWELTGIVVAGTAGLRMGWALIDTGGRTRVGSLAAVAPALYRLMLGTTVMLLVAAAIEAFWSASPVPLVGKVFFAVVQVVLIAIWLTFGGRR